MDTYRELSEICDRLAVVRDSIGGVHSEPLFTDRIAEMPLNPNPFQSDMVARRWFDWPSLDPDDIDGITIHHTMSHSPEALARYCCFTKGFPSIQYHFWVSAGDNCPIWQLVPLSKGIWHDHTGAFQTHISVGLAGSLHLKPPPTEQLGQAAKLVVYLMNAYGIERANVRGHCDWAPAGTTVCPGWDSANWRETWEATLTWALMEDQPQ